MLPYPSGDLHIGHWYAMSPSDAGARYKRMNGYNVWFPIGFDAFGLPAENAAIKHGVHPHKWTLQNVATMREQLKKMGTMFDWEHEAISCLPGYYQWTEWFFRKFYDMGLAYREKAPVDFCPNCNTTLAREQVWGDDRHCERCGTPVEIRELEQWKFRITDYADELLDGLDEIDWPERVKTMQRNWIGRSEGVEFEMKIQGREDLSFRVFTTRPDTTFGMTFAVLAPEHPLVEQDHHGRATGNCPGVCGRGQTQERSGSSGQDRRKNRRLHRRLRHQPGQRASLCPSGSLTTC